MQATGGSIVGRNKLYEEEYKFGNLLLYQTTTSLSVVNGFIYWKFKATCSVEITILVLILKILYTKK